MKICIYWDNFEIELPHRKGFMDCIAHRQTDGMTFGGKVKLKVAENKSLTLVTEHKWKMLNLEGSISYSWNFQDTKKLIQFSRV